METSRVLFPLRSSTGWFASADTRDELERRLKNYSILYDELVFQNRRYVVKFSETRSFAAMYPPGKLPYPYDRDTIEYHSHDDPFWVGVGDTTDGEFLPMFEGPVVDTYQADFYPVLKEAGLLGMSPARLQSLDNGHPVSPYTVQRELGHSSLDMIQRVYGRLSQFRLRTEGVHCIGKPDSGAETPVEKLGVAR